MGKGEKRFPLSRIAAVCVDEVRARTRDTANNTILLNIASLGDEFAKSESKNVEKEK